MRIKYDLQALPPPDGTLRKGTVYLFSERASRRVGIYYKGLVDLLPEKPVCAGRQTRLPRWMELSFFLKKDAIQLYKWY